jgi:hypothetical protein
LKKVLVIRIADHFCDVRQFVPEDLGVPSLVPEPPKGHEFHAFLWRLLSCICPVNGGNKKPQSYRMRSPCLIDLLERTLPRYVTGPLLVSDQFDIDQILALLHGAP